MHNYEHKRLIEAITELDTVPADSKAFSEWIEAEAHLEFLRMNARADELVIYASAQYTFVHSVAVPNDQLSPVDQQDLMQWSFNPYMSIASYVTGGGREDVWVERHLSGTGTKTLKDAVQLIFARTFEGWNEPGRNYYELHQEYAHLTGIHWRPERRAYCRFDGRGDIEPVVSVTSREDRNSTMALVSFKWEPLEEYLAASNTSLVRMFDFTLLRRSGFNGWSGGDTQEIIESPDFFFRQRVMPGYAAYTRGVQIIRPRRSLQAIFRSITDERFGKERQHVEFLAYDWRNERLTKISTDPMATTNYYQTEGNTLPFELSPVFFRPEVLLKYKADRDKYTVGERDVSCRAAWHLQAIDINEAGQVHAYICYLRDLPYEEQLHWLSFNEPPKAPISKRAVTNDFQGEWESFDQPLRRVLSIVQRWHYDKVMWWTLRDEKLLERVNTPVTASRDEWAEAFMDLAKLVVEGFETNDIRARLDAAQVPYGKEDKTISLLERLLGNTSAAEDIQKLNGLRTVQLLRSKAKGHASGREAQQLAQDALMEHETFANHFQYVCGQVANELEAIEKRMA